MKFLLESFLFCSGVVAVSVHEFASPRLQVVQSQKVSARALFQRQSTCPSSYQICGDGCILSTSSCCSAAEGKSCPSGFYCDGTGADLGCCENGKKCSGPGLGCPGDSQLCGGVCLDPGTPCTTPSFGPTINPILTSTTYHTTPTGVQTSTALGSQPTSGSCISGEDSCGIHCIPSGYVCCSTGYCDPGYACAANGKCRFAGSSRSSITPSEFSPTTTSFTSNTDFPEPSSTGGFQANPSGGSSGSSSSGGGAASSGLRTYTLEDGQTIIRGLAVILFSLAVILI